MTKEEAFEKWFSTAEASQVWSRKTVHTPFGIGYAAGRLAALRECEEIAKAVRESHRLTPGRYLFRNGAQETETRIKSLIAAEEGKEHGV